jgi:signal transduction histidine kinase
LPAKIRRNILAVVKEALNNAVRHSGGSEVWLRLRREAGVLVVAVEDNGRGMNEADGAGKGNGLRNMRKRMETLGGSLEISSPPVGGTTIQLRIRLEDGH